MECTVFCVSWLCIKYFKTGVCIWFHLFIFTNFKSAIIVINCVSPSIITKVIILQSVKKKKIPNRSCHCKNSLRICCPLVVWLGNRRCWAGVWSTGWQDRGWGRLGMMNGLADNNCHNPTNKTKQNKTTLVGVVLLSVKTHHHGCIKQLPGNLGSWVLVCSLVITQLEDNLIFF